MKMCHNHSLILSNLSESMAHCMTPQFSLIVENVAHTILLQFLVREVWSLLERVRELGMFLIFR